MTYSNEFVSLWLDSRLCICKFVFMVTFYIFVRLSYEVKNRQHFNLNLTLVLKLLVHAINGVGHVKRVV